MKKGAFFIQIHKQEGNTFTRVEGYIKQEGAFWFGVHKTGKTYAITHLGTGLKVRDRLSTIKECEEALPNCASVCQNMFDVFDYRKAMEDCENAYCTDDSPEISETGRKIFDWR